MDIYFYIPEMYQRFRLDICLSRHIGCSRSYAAILLKNGNVSIDGIKRKPSYKVNKGSLVSGCVPKIKRSFSVLLDPEDIPLEILYEDSDFLVINKKSGIVTHPSPGHISGTVVNAVLYRYPGLESIFKTTTRPGIVHRLDKDTTGVLVIARNMKAFTDITYQFRTRSVIKRYLAIVYGVPRENCGVVDSPIGRHPVDRKKMSTYSYNLKSAITSWKVLRKYGKIASLLMLNIKTGRTHQIRVHCKTINHPIIGDQIYKNKGLTRLFKNISPVISKYITKIDHQMLHSYKLTLKHPSTGISTVFKAKLPYNMRKLINILSKL